MTKGNAKMDRKQSKGGRVDLNVTCTQNAADLVAEDGATQKPNTLEEKPKIQFCGDSVSPIGVEKTLITGNKKRLSKLFPLCYTL